MILTASYNRGFNRSYNHSFIMLQVCELQHEIIRPNIDKLMFYYGQGDPWCPVQYYHDMKKSYPEADIRLCARNMEHAFVLEYSHSMAEVLWDWMIEKVPDLNHRK